ncbi:MAG: mannose-1-phosphate guanylyltransferase/mannose-6-phosphate isomerase [Burkholderiales bacterium]|nr:mannose-1-phosphate guanylyltransferase/mannose-6-phosphate isomerase [Burkholderiales bacterium]
MSPIIPVILSGGAGTRLWPLSRESAPKPFMVLPDGETLLGKTAHRAMSIAGTRGLVTVTNRDYYFHTKDVYAGLGGREPQDAAYLLEPFGRNTAPAVAIAAMLVRARYGDDAVMLVLAADHLIRDEAAFAESVAQAAALARAGKLVTFGITPTLPETGFGYIECGTELGKRGFAAVKFIEKPPLAQARDYLAAGNYVWNSGMFAFTAGTILAAFDRHAPVIAAAVRTAWQPLATRGHDAMLEIDAASFATAPDVSIDYALMEPAAAEGIVAVVRGDFDWSDVGSWQAVSELSDADADGNRGSGERVAIDTRGTFVHSEDRMVATIGVENLVIVDTPDAVLIAHRDQLQRVKEVVGELKARGHDSYKLHRTVARPWGSYTILGEGPGFKIKRIEVKPGGALSLQLHHRRTEHWVVVRGTAHVTCGDHAFDLPQGESTFIPVGTMHRLENRSGAALAIIEVACGDYIAEDDIVRFDDQYGRARPAQDDSVVTAGRE